MSAHTPGPWEADSDEGLVCIIAPGSTLGFDNQPIAEISLWADVDDPDDDYKKAQSEAIANARLIAAAPDMLDACKKLETTLANLASDIRSGRPFNPDAVENINSARASAMQAIAKAEGGQP